METGDFMEPGQPALPGVEHRGAVKEYGVSSLRGAWASGRGGRDSLPGRCRRFVCVFSLPCVVRSALCWSGWPSSECHSCH